MNLRKGNELVLSDLCMEIVKAFTSNSLHTEIVIRGTVWDPLFRASDIGAVLGITNIRTSIMNFDHTEREVHTMNTLGGDQSVTFLTEKGLYKVLFKCRKEIAVQFQNWVCDVIKEIRLSGKYELTQLKEKNSQLQREIKENSQYNELMGTNYLA